MWKKVKMKGWGCGRRLREKAGDVEESSKKRLGMWKKVQRKG